MNNFETEYNEINKKLDMNNEELAMLKNDEIVRRYLELLKQNESLKSKQELICKEFITDKYDKCKHIFVNTKDDYDKLSGRVIKCWGCIKCGLDNSVFQKKEPLTFNDKISIDYLKRHFFYGLFTNESCDIDYAKLVYSRIKENNPDIDDRTAIKYFKIAINNMKKEDKHKDRKQKRLSLYNINVTVCE